MRKTLLLCVVLLMSCISSTVFAQTQTSPTRGVLRVKVQEELATQISTLPQTRTGGIVTTGITPFDRANQRVKAVKMERVFPYDAKNEAKLRKHGLHLWYRVIFDEGYNPLEAKQLYAQIPGISRVENVVPMSLIDGNKGFVKLTEAQMKAANTRSADAPFNDPMLSKQWHYQNDGSMNGSVKGADINLFKAWELATGNKELVVAIIDGGVDYQHKDLAANIWVNETELNGTTGVDDSGDGYVDDIHGYNFVTKSGEVYPHEHGTHVAGTVGAVNNNGIGVCGVAGGNGQGGVRLMSCQVFDPRTNTQGDFAEAIVFAANHGAVIAQCSWGWDADGYYEQAVLDAIDYFTEEAHSDFMKGGLCIFSSGNTGAEEHIYPGCYESVVGVAAMTYDKKPATYSTYGEWCDIAAPGGFMDYDASQGVFSTLPNDNYGYSEGTSMACPHVSGIAALVLSKYGSPTFPNETLRQQLLTSVNDFYTDNPGIEGKFGSGYIDAYKALHMGSGKAPEAVADFTMSPSQDNILLEWTIPASEDNNVNYHIIYYSKDAFTANSDLNAIPHKTVDSKFYSSGDPMSYEIGGLLSMTTYYIAIRAVNRWGDLSALSPVKTATTNAGPKMKLDQTSLTMTLDATQSSTATAKFAISNTDEGLLKWQAYTRTASIETSGVAKVTAPGVLVPFYGKMSVTPFNNYPVVSADYVSEDYPKSFSYSESVDFYIGDSDLEVSNSAAQLFTVDKAKFPNGFNLTSLNFLGFMGEKPVIEIYKGGSSIAQASLLEKVDYSWYSHTSDLELNEQIFFEPGESFWVVIHFPSGQKSPLGAGLREDELYKSYAFYSSDMGETWTQLNETLREGNLADYADKVVWNITAISKNPDWSSVIKLTPDGGTVKSAETQDVTVSNDGQKLVNGDYGFNLRLTTNESDATEKALPISFKVSGYKPELQTAKVVDFGDLLVGESKKLSVEIVNKGYGAFGGQFGNLSSQNLTCSSDQFEVDTYAPAFAARTTSSINITYKPTTEGSHTGTITLTDKEGTSHSFIVRGVAAQPAKINVAPTSFEVGDLEVGGATVEKKFVIKNEGNYPLEYVFPKFSDETIEGMTKTAHKFGYSYITNLNGATDFEYDGNPDLINATDITSQFTDNDLWAKPIDLGFAFPYYGENYTQIYVTNYGAMAVSTDGYIHQCNIPSATPGCIEGLGLISGYGMNQLRMGTDSKVEWAKQDGKFVVKFSHVMASVYDKEYTPVSFHMTLSPNGDVECFYDDFKVGGLFMGGSGLFVGLNDIKVNDPCTLTDCDSDSDIYQYFTSGSAVKFVAPGKSMVKSLSSANGVIGIGESKEITATLAASEGMYAGKLVNTLVILSNDPAQNTAYVTLTANITGDALKPAAALKSTAIEFGKIFRTATVKLPVEVQNNGTNVLKVTGIALANNAFTYEAPELPFEVAPGTSKDVVMTLPTKAEGEVADEVSITCEDGTVLKATLKGTVIGVPEIALTPESFTETTPSGVALNKQLEIKNSGNEALEYTIVPNDYVTLADLSVDATSKLTYIYSASVDNEDIKYAWEDIETNGLGVHHKLSYFLEHDQVAVDLPYEITFYGNTYKKMYIYGAGFVSFTQRADMMDFPTPPTTLPTTETIFDNLIAPFWGLHSMDETSTAGTFYAFKDDHIVVSFMEYGNTMNRGVCFQVLIYRNGNIKFQYKFADYGGEIQALYGVVGLQSEKATDGFVVPARCIIPGEAIEIYPVKTATVAAGATAKLDMVLNADEMAGVYNANIVMNTNVPTKSVVNVPIQLTITGEAKPVFPETLGGESVVGVTSDGFALNLPFTVANNGTAAFTIKKIESELVGNDDPSGLPSRLWYYGERSDDDPGPLSTYAEMTPMPYLEGNAEIVVGKEPIKFYVMFEKVNEVASFDYPLVFTIESQGETKEITVPFKLAITPAPALSFDKPEIRISGANADYAGEASLKMMNTGEYKLTYQLLLDPSGIGEQPEDIGGGGGVDPMMSTKVWSKGKLLVNQTMKASKMAATRASSVDLPTGDYNNALYYPIADKATVTYNYGAGDKYSQFMAATQFQAPEKGFNLSDIYFLALVGPLSNVDIKAEIIQGSDVVNGAVIGKGTLHVTEPDQVDGVDQAGEPIYRSAFRILQLDKAIYLNPNEKFYVKLIFPAGYEFSMSLVPKADAVVEDRYMAANVGSAEWGDVGKAFEGGYGSLGFLMTCIEREASEPWIKLLTAETNGEIAVDGFADVKLHLNAKTARLDGSNKAVLVVKSNDPQQPIFNYPIYLDKNKAPQNDAPASTIYVKEGATATLNIKVQDEEFDNFTVALADEKGIVKIESVTPVSAEDGLVITKTDDLTVDVKAAEGAANGTASGVVLKVVIAPGYDASGAHTFTLTAKDALDNTAVTKVNYSVEDVNRAPVAKKLDDFELKLGETTPILDYKEFFEDPDGDEMTYELTISKEGIVDAYAATQGVILSGLKVGEVEVTIKATDAKGASTSMNFKVKVMLETGIGEVELKDAISVYPNPVVDKATIICRVNAETEISYKLYNSNGTLLSDETVTKSNGEAHYIDMTGYAAGVYYLTVTVDGTSTTLSVLKK